VQKLEPLLLPSGGTITFADPDIFWRGKHTVLLSKMKWDLATPETDDAGNEFVRIVQGGVFDLTFLTMWALARDWSVPYLEGVKPPGLCATFDDAKALLNDSLGGSDFDAMVGHVQPWVLKAMGWAPVTPGEPDAESAEVSEGKADAETPSSE
jgi:hypothetical protein